MRRRGNQRTRTPAAPEKCRTDVARGSRDRQPATAAGARHAPGVPTRFPRRAGRSLAHNGAPAPTLAHAAQAAPSWGWRWHSSDSMAGGFLPRCAPCACPSMRIAAVRASAGEPVRLRGCSFCEGLTARRSFIAHCRGFVVSCG